MLCEKTGHRYTHHQIMTKKLEWCMRTDVVALYNNLLQKARERVHSSGSVASTQTGGFAVTL